MTNFELFNVVSTLLSLAGLWVLACWFWGDYRLDAFRQRMFVLRDEWFDFADGGGISFDHPAYGLLRSTMNGFIRFAHRMAPFEFGVMLIWWAIRGVPTVSHQDFHARWENAVSDLDEATKTALLDFRRRMETIGLGYTAPWIPLLIQSVGRGLQVVLLWFRIRRRFAAMLRSQQVNFIDSMAMAIGEN